MATEPQAHPAKDQLIAFGQGRLAEDESSRVEQHLEVCRECCETLLDLKDDTFVGLVKIAQPSIVLEDAARVRTDPGADSSCVGHDSAHSATLLVQSGEAVTLPRPISTTERGIEANTLNLFTMLVPRILVGRFNDAVARFSGFGFGNYQLGTGLGCEVF